MKRRLRPRRPKNVSGPKRLAFPVGGGAPVRASHAQPGTGFYEYAYRPVQRKTLPNKTKTDSKNWYFAFTRGGGSGGDGGGGGPLTPTHAMMQAIIYEKKFVQCTINGALFWAELADVKIEDRRAANIARVQGERRPDIGARCVKATVDGIRGGPLDIEIAVTNPIRTRDRFTDLIKAKRPCIELFVERNEAVETDARKLDDDLKKRLFSEEFSARWVVAPDGSKAEFVPLAAFRKRAEKERSLNDADLALRRREIDDADRARRVIPGVADSSEDRTAFAKIEAERTKLLTFAAERDRLEGSNTPMLRLLVESIIPGLRQRRLQSRAQRMAEIRSEIRAEFEP